MEDYTIIILIFSLILLFLLVMIYFINHIFIYKNKIDNSFFTIKELIDERITLIENIIKFIEETLEHEQNFKQKLVGAKQQLLKLKNNKEGIKLIKNTEKDIFNFIKLDNTYNYLAKNKNYQKLKESLLNNKEKLVYAFDLYDKGVINYNNYLKNKLYYFLTKLCRLEEYDCYNK